MRSVLRRAAGPLVLAAVVCLLSAVPGRADSSPSTTRLGKQIENVALQDLSGQPLALHDLKDKKAVVVVFLSFDCPVSTNYSQTLATMSQTYADRGVAFLGVCAGEDVDAAQLAKQVKDFAIPFPVCRDAKGAAIEALKAEITPEAFILDHHFILRYRGRIDNAYAARLKKNVHITSHDLRKALDELLAGKPISEPATPAVGCPIRGDRAVQASGKVTYHKDVLPILQSHCQGCHRPGEVGPFALMTYKQAVNWAGDIKEYTHSRKMPPWKPAESVPFHNDRRLPDKDIATLAAWADGGTPEGDPNDAPPPRKFPDGWQLGQPDLVLSMPEDFVLGPSGRDHFRVIVVPTNLAEDKYVTTVEVRPGNPRIVHHALLFVDTSGEARKRQEQAMARPRKPDEVDVGPGYTGAMGTGIRGGRGLGGWAPGQIGRHLPEGTGYLLPKGSDVIMQMHYHRDGRVEKDRTQIGLYFAKKPIQKPFQGLLIAGGRSGLPFLLNIPAGDAKHRVTGSMWVDRDCELHSVMPHMHMIGKTIKVTMIPPDGQPLTLVAISEWDYNWQETYFLKEAIKVKAGTRFDVEAIYDNSATNPNNPFNPPQNIRFGQQTTDEMCFVFLGATSDKPGRLVPQFFQPRRDGKPAIPAEKP